jgi:hypothetical protein
VFEAEHRDMKREAAQEQSVGLIARTRSEWSTQNEAEAATELGKGAVDQRSEGRNSAGNRATGRGEGTSRQSHQAE